MSFIKITSILKLGFHLLVLGFLIFPLAVSGQIREEGKLLKNSAYPINSEEYIQELLDSAFKNVSKQKKEIALIYSIEAINVSSRLELSDHAQMRLNDGLAGTFGAVDAYHYAIVHSKKAISLTHQLSPENYFGLALKYGRVGSLYLLNHQVDSALFFFRKAIPMTIKNGDNVYIASAHNNLGIAYSKIDEDSALYCFNFAKTILKHSKRNDSSLISSINDNLADLYFSKKKYSKAEPLYEWNYIFLSSHKHFQKRASEAGIQLAEIYFLKKNFSKLESFLETLSENLDSSNYDQKRRIFHIKADYYRSIGDFEKERISLKEEIKTLGLLQKKGKETQEIVAARLNDYSIKRIEKQLELEKLKTTTQRNLLELSEQKSINRLTLIWASVFSFILVIIILYLNYRTKIETRKRAQEKLDNELALKKRDLEDFALEIVQKQDWTDKLSERLMEIKNLDKEEITLAVRGLLNDVKGTQVAAKQKKIFQQNIEEVNHSFFEKLNQQFGNLTKTERELAGFLRMELSNKEIANLKNMEVNSVKRGRSRLRKKLNLAPETDIYTFLKSL